MASLLSKFAAHVSQCKQLVLTGAVYQFQRGLNCTLTVGRVINTVCRFERFSTSSACWRLSEVKNLRVVKPLLNWYQYVAVLFGTVGVSVAAISSSAVSAMSSRPDLNLDSEKSDWRQIKKKLQSMSLEERRAVYMTGYITLDKVPVWNQTGSTSTEPFYKPDKELNQKISLFRGDITKLEIDAIANAANKTLLGGGGVDGAIHRGAGPLLRKECATLGGCQTGEAKITGAYGLPAKYVIHTVGPIAHGSVGESEERALQDCYYNCLHTATENQLRTVAFPCISTGVYGYPPEKAVEVALKTVREYLEQHDAQMDRVILCVFLKSDEELYKSRLPAYFPKAC
ncbi:ADP-ribose glycohydrolase MACROD1 isoform X2 [Trichomycterus rosablanca]|uniref:ADP-ribose glycohydrolase MACROD1 isoform X2 n=1 Tax=Trichomycterus rosablanca TaxID=2290929 RepID=UPI002F3600CD